MIVKGASRSNATYWSRHLVRTDHNEQVVILEMPSGYAQTGAGLQAALGRFQAMAGFTRGQKGLYCLHIDPAKHYAMQGEDWQSALAIATEELGYKDQPRIVVKHMKDGREHIHAVFQRTQYDAATGQWRLIPDGWNYKAHEVAARKMEVALGHEAVPGVFTGRDRDPATKRCRDERPVATLNHQEWQQGERTGKDPRDVKATLAQLWREHPEGPAFVKALERAGYRLARGDSKPIHMIVDADGEAYDLRRSLSGVKKKEIEARLIQHPAETLATVADTRKTIRDGQERQTEAKAQEERRRQAEATEAAAKQREARQRQEREEAERRRQAELKQQQDEMTRRRMRLETIRERIAAAMSQRKAEAGKAALNREAATIADTRTRLETLRERIATAMERRKAADAERRQQDAGERQQEQSAQTDHERRLDAIERDHGRRTGWLGRIANGFKTMQERVGRMLGWSRPAPSPGSRPGQSLPGAASPARSEPERPEPSGKAQGKTGESRQQPDVVGTAAPRQRPQQPPAAQRPREAAAAFHNAVTPKTATGPPAADDDYAARLRANRAKLDRATGQAPSQPRREIHIPEGMPPDEAEKLRRNFERLSRLDGSLPSEERTVANDNAIDPSIAVNREKLERLTRQEPGEGRGESHGPRLRP